MCSRCQATNPNYCICMFCGLEYDKCICDHSSVNRSNNLLEVLDDVDDTFTEALEEND